MRDAPRAIETAGQKKHEQWKKKTGCLGYMGDYTTQLYMGMFRMFYLNQKQIDTQLQSDFFSGNFLNRKSCEPRKRPGLTFHYTNYTGCLTGILTMVY